jgi:hypothetical protein
MNQIPADGNRAHDLRLRQKLIDVRD